MVKEADPVAPAAPGEERPPEDRVDLEDRVAQAARADPVAVPAGRVVACRDSTVLRHLERAQRQVFFADLNKRRIELGLQPRRPLSPRLS